MTTLDIGAVYTATLHGLAGDWDLHGTATLWAVRHHDGQDHVTLQLSDSPRPHRMAHTAYAHGRVSVLTDGRRQLVSPLTPMPGLTAITLGWTVQHRRDPAAASHHAEQAAIQLADYSAVGEDGGPLGVSALTHLAQAVADAREAERRRDDLVRRLRAGGVPRSVVASTAGLVPTRITQLCRPAARERMDA
jgi:hypothetical protein